MKKLKGAQKTKIIRTLSETPPEDDHWLHWWIQYFFGLNFALRPCSPEHTAPFKIVADGYFGRHPVFIVKGSRGLAGKSLSFGVTGSLLAALKGYEINIFGGSGEQSKNVQKYLTGTHPKMKGLMWDHHRAPKHLIRQGTTTEARFKGGGVARALNASQTHARGGHPNKVICDEIDEMNFDLFESILGQPQGEEAGAIAGSTHQHETGTMTDAIDMADTMGWPVHEVCYKCNHVDNGGWLTDEMIALKRQTMTPETWRVEVELQEPNPEGRIFNAEHLEILFDPDWGEFPDEMGFEYEVIPPEAPGSYVHGADWGKKLHNTCLHTFRESDTGPDQLAAWAYMRRIDWPFVIGRYNERVRNYGGKARHDETGIGDVIGSFIDPSLDSEGIQFSQRMLIASMFSGYVGACQAGDEITLPMIPRLYRVMSRLTNDQVYYGGHPPDEFVAGALAYSLTKKAKRARKRRKKGLQMGRA